MGRGAKLPKVTAPQVESMPGFEGRYRTEDGYIFGFESFAEAGDFTPFYRGLPDDLCRSHHWGDVIKGRMIMHRPEGDIVAEAGEAYYVGPGHTGEVGLPAPRSSSSARSMSTRRPWPSWPRALRRRAANDRRGYGGHLLHTTSPRGVIDMTDRHDRSESRPRAGHGERVTICIETIKAEKKAEFDRLVHDVLGPAGLEANSRVFEYLRLIEPSEANSDGTWSYVSILDPVIADGDYRVQHTLESKYGPAEGEKYAKAYHECYAAPVKVYRGAQASWGALRAAA